MNGVLNELNENGVDIKSVIERFAGNEELCTKFILKFVDDKSFNEAKEALAEKDFEQVLVGVHTLKGVSANLGMTDLYKECDSVVIKIRANDYEIEQDMQKIEDEYNRIVSIIKKYK